MGLFVDEGSYQNNLKKHSKEEILNKERIGSNWILRKLISLQIGSFSFKEDIAKVFV